MKPYGYILGILGPIVLLTAMATDVPVAGGKAGANLDGGALPGQELYESRCTGCHSLDGNRVGSRLRADLLAFLKRDSREADN